MPRGFWTLVWIETKIFLREPLGVVASLVVPVVIFLAVGRLAAGEVDLDARQVDRRLIAIDIPVFAVVLMVLGAVVSVVAIIAIYRESGVLRRLRATPLRSSTIFAAHVVVKLLLTAVALVIMMAAGRRYVPTGVDVPVGHVVVAALVVTASLMAFGFLIASLAPTARFAQPLASLVLYPMIGVSGLFVPVGELPPAVERIARLLPLTPAVSLLRGIWMGDAWSAHLGDLATLVLMVAVSSALAVRTFRWE